MKISTAGRSREGLPGGDPGTGQTEQRQGAGLREGIVHPGLPRTAYREPRRVLGRIPRGVAALSRAALFGGVLVQSGKREALEPRTPGRGRVSGRPNEAERSK